MTRHLLVIGGQRCGTTYLHALLDAHPDIAMARPVRPEPKVFLSAEESARGLEWYHRTYFGHATTERLLGEKSTSYIEHPEAAERAAAMLGAPIVLALLRDPVARAVSNWRFSVAGGFEERPLVDALTENLSGSRPWDPELTSVSPFAYLERGRYADQLVPWLERFPDTASVSFFEELTTDDAAVSRLYDRLGVDTDFRPDRVDRPVNSSDGPEPELPGSLLSELRDYFRASDERLRALLGCDLPWASARTETRGSR